MCQRKGEQIMKQRLGYSAFDLEKLGLGSRNHIYRMIKRGEIPYVELGQRQIIPSWWVDKFFKDPSVQSPKDTSNEDEVFNCPS